MASRHLLASLVLVGVCSMAQGAKAQVDKSAAVVLFDEAQRLMRDGKIAEACPKFAESNRMDPQLGALLHLADCYERVGQYASAWAAFREAAELADRRADARSLAAKDRASALEAKLSRITILVPEGSIVPGMEVRRDGVVVRNPLWGTAVPVDPGTHQVEVTAPGKAPWREIVEVAGTGDTATVNVPALADAVAGEPAATPAQGAPLAASPSLDDRSPRGTTQRVLGWSAIGAGGVGLVVGGIFTLQRARKLDERDNEVCPSGENCTAEEQREINELTREARDAGRIGVIGLIGGAVLAGGGVALLLTAPKSEQSASISPILGADLAGVTLHGAF